MYECAGEDGMIIEFADECIKNDKDIVIVAVKQNPMALQFASEELRNDK
jgi:hypothetical protein